MSCSYPIIVVIFVWMLKTILLVGAQEDGWDTNILSVLWKSLFFKWVYKNLTCRYFKNVNLHLELHQDNITRGHTGSVIMINSKCHYDLRKFSFLARIVNIWNSLSASVVSANNVNTFKNRVYRFWINRELIYNYKSTLTKIGNRSSVDNFDDTF